VCFDFLYICLKHFSFFEELSELWSKMCIGLQVQFPLFLSDFSETWTFSSYFRKILKYVKFHENSSSADRRTDRPEETDSRFCNFANAPKMLDWR